MNIQQMSYHKARIDRTLLTRDLLTLSSIPFLCTPLLDPSLPLAHTLFNMAFGFVIGEYISKDSKEERFDGFCNHEERERIRKYCREKYPLCFVEKITIEDGQGLEDLLKRTAGKEKLEWGTALRSVVHRKRARVQEILNSYEAEEKKFVLERKKTSIHLDFEKMIRAGYNGYHHFHPGHYLSYGTTNFIVSERDKHERFHGSGGSINLLTFNMPYGPELIAYNLFDTFIPTDDSKRELVKATPRDIHRYLGRRTK